MFPWCVSPGVSPWCRLSGRCGAGDSDVSDYLHHGGAGTDSAVVGRLNRDLNDESMKMLNLGHLWINTLLPFVLSKTNRVAYGLLLPEGDYSLLTIVIFDSFWTIIYV